MLLWSKERSVASFFYCLKFIDSTRREENTQVFPLYRVSLHLFIHKGNRNSAPVRVPLGESETDDSASSFIEVSSLDDDFIRMDLESRNFDEGTNDGLYSQVWSEIQPESDVESMGDYGLVQEVKATWGDNKILSIDCYRHFVTDEIIELIDHKLEERNGSDHDIRIGCAGCYEKTRQQQSREASNATAKKVKTFCSDCDKFFCLGCLNEEKHSV